MFCSLSPLFGIRQGLFKDGQSFLFLPGEFRDGGKTLELPRFSSVAMTSSTNRSILWSFGPDSTVMFSERKFFSRTFADSLLYLKRRIRYVDKFGGDGLM